MLGTPPEAWLNETLLCRVDPDDTDGIAPPAQKTVEPDEILGRRLHVYDCHSLLGVGGMGRVYLAKHIELHRDCALKILSPRTASQDGDFVARFRNEGRSTAALVHPNIVTIHATGIVDSYHYLEMEFVSGRTLQELINEEGSLTPIRATVLAAAIATGLASAHRRGILHRDLKPDNVLMTRGGVPKIADFGLAKRIFDDGGKDLLVGTPNYMAPELLTGEAATTASDVYALGVCYFQLLTGRLPFTGGALSELREAVLNDPVPSVREFNDEITLEMAECVSMMLSKTPENRPQDGFAAAQLLQAVAGQARDIESLLREAFRGNTNASWTRLNDRYEVIMNLPDGRRQAVFIEPGEHETSGKLLLIYSVCCPAQPEFFEEALQLNADLPHGSVAIRNVDGTPQFVMIDTYPRATVDAEEIRGSVLEVALRADDIEHRLTGDDRN